MARSAAGRDIVVLNETHIRQSDSALGRRIALAPPARGEWALVGRAEDLSRLHERLQANETLALTGLGGLGKSALALGYLNAHGASFDLIAWIDAEKPELIPAQYRLLLAHHTGRDVSHVDAVASAKALLANQSDWLLVFDNAVCADELFPYLPNGSGKVLITTRNETWSSNEAALFPVEPLSDEAVQEWIGSNLADAGSAAVAQLAARLAGLPLAVVQAIAYLRARPGETVRAYLEKLDTTPGQVEVLSVGKPPNYPEPLARTWRVAVEALSAERPAAIGLLEHLSYLDPSGIQRHLLKDLLPEGGASGAIEGLRKYGLVHYARGTLHVHRLVQDVTRWSISVERERSLVLSLSDHLERAAPPGEDYRSFEWFVVNAPHILTLLEHDARLQLNSYNLAALANEGGRCLIEQDAFGLALSLVNPALRILEANDQSAETVSAVLNNLGNAHHGLGRHSEAQDSFERARNLLERNGDTKSTNYVSTLVNLGNIYCETGRYRHAGDLYARAARIAESIYGRNHPQVARAIASIGIASQYRGDYVEAERCFLDSLSLFKECFGSKHPLVAQTLLNVAASRIHLGTAEGAVRDCRDALKIYTECYGDTHPQISTAYSTLGRAYTVAGQLEEALSVYGAAAQVAGAVYGVGSIQTISSLLNLAQANEAAGKTAAALRAYDAVIAILESREGPNGPNVADIRGRRDAASRGA